MQDLMNVAKRYHIYPGFATVGYPNRDSSIYKERYQIPEAQTIIRYNPPPNGSCAHTGY